MKKAFILSFVLLVSSLSVQSGPSTSVLLSVKRFPSFLFPALSPNPVAPPMLATTASAPSAGPLALVAPLYNCSTGAITFQTSGGNGTTIEFRAIGITGWTANPNQFLDRDARTAGDTPPFTLHARQGGQAVTYTWSRQTHCSTTTPP